MGIRLWTKSAILAITAAMVSGPANAQSQQPLLADSFRLGSGGGVLCQVQTRSRLEAITNIFDRSWTIVCRDAARPVGRLFALRGSASDILKALNNSRVSEARCEASTQTQKIEDIGQAVVSQCKLTDAEVGYSVISTERRGITWVVEGLTAYDSALKLALRSAITNRIVPGQVSVATSSVDDPVAFARVQAGTLDPDKALGEGYRRNNAGNYAEAAEFFDALQQRLPGSTNDRELMGEYLINQALQRSNLGAFAEADKLLDDARQLTTVDRVQTRLRRNFEAMNLLNQQRYDEALDRLDVPVAAIPKETLMPNSAIEIGKQVAAEINSGVPTNQRLGASESTALTPEERAAFLDAQASQLRGTLLRLKGQPRQALPLLEGALIDTNTIRNGRVVSVIRLRSQIIAETGLALESSGDAAGGEAKMREAVALLETRYPQTVAMNSARARLAALLARNGKAEAAMAEYRAIISSLSASDTSVAGLGNLLSPYLTLLAERIPANPALVDDMFAASQALVRPGVADTQAVLSRALSEKGSEAGRLFRQSQALSRDIERGRIDLANLAANPEQGSDIKAALTVLQQDISSLEKEQAATQAKLSAFPQFRAVTGRGIALGELRQVLRPDEAYFKLIVAGRAVYAIYVDAKGATAYRTAVSVDGLEQVVNTIRDTISADEGGQRTTYAFDAQSARKLYLDLLGPVSDRIRASKSIVFDPDGAMLRLPLNLLIASQTGLDAYSKRIADPNIDQFDMRGVDWLGRGRYVTTTVSAKAFRDSRTTPASSASRQYLGFGENAPVGQAVRAALTRSATGGSSINCAWPSATWNQPIAKDELILASGIIGGNQSEVVTGAQFTDTSVLGRSDLSNYRILHFATHGLVTAPRPECPARPALLTSFGADNSDGLLSFREIFDLQLDADLIILSACDTAGRASLSATREAGLTSGGGNALDGLVRAFIGAGGRTVLASHWPAPEEFGATAKLMSGLFRANPGTSVGEAMLKAQQDLLDSADTSHPFYWAGFAIVGDGNQAVLKP